MFCLRWFAEAHSKGSAFGKRRNKKALIKDFSPSSNMISEVICSPPLDTTTIIGPNVKQFDFSVLLRFDIKDAPRYNVAIWNNFAGVDKWSQTELTQEKSSIPTQSVFTRDRSHYWVRFVGSLPRPSDCNRVVAFTVRYRNALPQSNPEESDPDWDVVSASSSGERSHIPENYYNWHWVQPRYSVNHGHFLFAKPPGTFSDQFEHYFKSKSDHVSAKLIRACTSKPAQVWRTTSTLGPCDNEKATRGSFCVGKPQQVARWFSLIRYSSPWLVPKQGADTFDVDKDAVLVAFERIDGQHVVIVPMSGISGSTAVLRSGEGGVVEIRANNVDECKTDVTAFVAVADTFQIAAAAAVYAAQALTSHDINDDGQVSVLEPVSVETPHTFSPDVIETGEMEWYDHLTYCTWNSIGNQLTEEKIINSLDSLRNDGITVSHLIIDDNWQDLNLGGRLLSFEANKRAFPDGLKSGLTKIRDRNPNIKDISMWHTMIGYWSGISPTGSLARNYGTTWVNRTAPSADWKEGDDGWLLFNKQDVHRAYGDFYQFLASCGATSVKTDYQCSLDDIRSPADRRDLIRAFQSAWLDATKRHLGGRGIACMAMAPVLMFDSQLKTGHRPIPVRSSDDYFPHLPHTHPWHVWVNAHNSTLVSLLNAVPDWDMFESKHDWAEVHGIARAISGGPITITDKPGEHNPGLVHKLSAISRSGRSYTLRPTGKGVTTSVYEGYLTPNLLRIKNYVTGPSLLVLLLALFNLAPPASASRRISEVVKLSDIVGPNSDPRQKWLIKGSHNGQIVGPVSVADNKDGREGEVVVSLGPKEWEVLSCYAVFSYSDISIATLGLAGKITGAAALSSVQYDTTTNPNELRIKSKLRGGVLGKVAFWIDGLEHMKWKDRMLAEVDGQPVPLDVVTVGRENPNVLEIDVGRVTFDPTFMGREEDICTISLFIRLTHESLIEDVV